MKTYSWNDDRNRLLKAERGVSFEEVVFYIERGYLLDIVAPPNPDRYGGQHIFIVAIDNYAYLIPFIETDSEVFLKTIIPSRKATRDYLKS